MIFAFKRFAIGGCRFGKSHPAEDFYSILHFKPLAGTRNSHSRRGSSMNCASQALYWHSKFTFPCVPVVNSAFRAPSWHSQFAFPLRFRSEVYISGPITGTRNSHSRCVPVMNSAFHAPCWHSKFAFPLRFSIEFCIPSPLLVLEIRIPTAFPY